MSKAISTTHADEIARRLLQNLGIAAAVEEHEQNPNGHHVYTLENGKNLIIRRDAFEAYLDNGQRSTIIPIPQKWRSASWVGSAETNG